LKLAGRPASAVDQHAVSARTEQPDDIRGGGRIQALFEVAFAHQVGDHVGGALTVLREL